MEWLTVFFGPLVQLIGKLNPVARFNRWWKNRGLRPAEGDRFTILVAHLDGDPTRARFRHILDALENHSGINLIGYGRVLRVEDIGATADKVAAAERRGRDWLVEMNADVLIWGEVREPGPVLRLRFLSRAGGAATAIPYRLDSETLELPDNFAEDLGNLLFVLALAAAAPATASAGQYLVELLRPVMTKVQNFIEHPPPSLDAGQLRAVRNSAGIAAAILGEQSGEEDWLRWGIVRQCVAQSDREAYPERDGAKQPRQQLHRTPATVA